MPLICTFALLLTRARVPVKPTPRTQAAGVPPTASRAMTLNLAAFSYAELCQGMQAIRQAIGESQFWPDCPIAAQRQFSLAVPRASEPAPPPGARAHPRSQQEWLLDSESPPHILPSVGSADR